MIITLTAVIIVMIIANSYHNSDKYNDNINDNNKQYGEGCDHINKNNNNVSWNKHNGIKNKSDKWI